MKDLMSLTTTLHSRSAECGESRHSGRLPSKNGWRLFFST